MSEDELVANVAHQVLTPLSVIRGYAELLAARDDDATRLEAAAQIREAADVLALMVDDLLIAFAVEAALLPVEPESLDIAAAADEAIESVAPRSSRHSFTTTWSDHGSVLARADPEHVTRVLTALLLNACRRSPDGGEVAIAGRNDGDDVRVSVSDQGPGLEADGLALAFERHRQGAASDRSELRSSGLELYKVRKLVELQGGSVGAKSTAGAGSTFEFTLPRAFEEAQR